MIANGEPSLTALTAAAARAAHLVVDDEPPIFADTLAEAMLGERADELIAFHRAHGTHPILSGARTQVTCRSRYTEDRLAEGIRRGIGQYVILGAGLDSFAGRSPLAGRVRVFEVDHPATQEWKLRARTAGETTAAEGTAAEGTAGEGPGGASVVFVPVDFGRDSLRDRLGRAGFDFAAPAFISWLGVTMYLDRDAIEQTLAAAGRFAAGTEIVVDYMLPAGWRDAAGDLYAEQVGQVFAERGEPWRSLFAPEELAELLGRHGFGPVRDVRQRDMVPSAAWERTDSLRPADQSRIAHAALGAGTLAGRSGAGCGICGGRVRGRGHRTDPVCGTGSGKAGEVAETGGNGSCGRGWRAGRSGAGGRLRPGSRHGAGSPSRGRATGRARAGPRVTTCCRRSGTSSS